MVETGQVTVLLDRARRGDRSVTDELMQLVYDELRRLAQHYMGRERPDHTLQATALVNEAYVRLVGSESGPWQNRAHFFAAAAVAIRRIIVQHARAAASQKRGGDWRRADVDPALLSAASVHEQILGVDEALGRLATMDAQKARLVELRYFAGMTTEEIAEALGVSVRTVAREWEMAKAWLSRELSEQDRDGR